MIELKNCKHSYLYRIFSRNLRFGVFDKRDCGFIGIREKYGYEYLFTEYHYEISENYGTVSPKEKLCFCPLELNENSQELFDWLEKKELEYDNKPKNS